MIHYMPNSTVYEGTVVQAINRKLGITTTNKFTAESEAKLKNFQQNYNKRLIKYEGTDTVSSETDPEYVLYPSGLVDIHTLTALLGTDITMYDESIIFQFQQCLKNTEYDADNKIRYTFNVDAPTKAAIKLFQTKYDIYQLKYHIEEGNAVPATCKYFSGMPNIVTYNKLKAVFNIEEALVH
jgi:hypothetical protein